MAGVGYRPDVGLDTRAAGAWMRRQRRLADWRDADLAAEAGISTWTLGAWEMGHNLPSLTGWIAWSEAMGLDPGQALGDLLTAQS
ncbi:MAG: helix-turn-helix domain-containing protein [Dehalococcoidia bacterium]|nr:helix-turn-helix domain-containing protein [Dehalococcoidia bacterium]